MYRKNSNMLTEIRFRTKDFRSLVQFYLWWRLLKFIFLIKIQNYKISNRIAVYVFHCGNLRLKYRERIFALHWPHIPHLRIVNKKQCILTSNNAANMGVSTFFSLNLQQFCFSRSNRKLVALDLEHVLSLIFQ